MTGALLVATLVALVGLSGFQARSHPALTWSAFAIPAFGAVVGLLAFAGRIVHVPDAKGLRDLHTLLGQQGRFVEQPAGALHVVQCGARVFIGRRLPGTFGAVVGVKTQAVYRLIAKPGAQAFAQLRPGQGLLRAVVEQVLALGHKHRQVLGHQAKAAYR